MATRRFLVGAALLAAAVWVAPAGAQQERQGSAADPGGAGCPAGQQRGPAGGCVSEDTGSTGVPATAGGGDAGGSATAPGGDAGGATSRGTLGTDRGGVSDGR